MTRNSGGFHASHQTGLDADIVLPALKPEAQMWNPCRTVVATKQIKSRDGKTRSVKVTTCAAGSPIVGLDDARFWQMLRGFTCADKRPVIAMFLDQQIKNHMCSYARSLGEDLTHSSSCAFRTLQALKHDSGHYNHVHIRLHCPGSVGCSESTVTLGPGTGC